MKKYATIKIAQTIIKNKNNHNKINKKNWILKMDLLYAKSVNQRILTLKA